MCSKGPVKFNPSDGFADTTNNNDENENENDCASDKVKEEFVENHDECAENIPNNTFSLSEFSKQTILNILEQINALPHLERFLIFLKLNEQITNAGDPLKQPLNPLGSRSEVCRTISWIKTHLEEDPEISLPKQQVYDEYSVYCSKIQMKPLSQADFGKVMKQVYPKVKARRLGTRGNSRYCYSGLRNCTKLCVPALPTFEESSELLSLVTQDEKKPLNQVSLTTAAWLIVKEWSENQLSSTFPSIQSLAFFLVVNCSVGVGTEAASFINSITSSEITDEACDVVKNEHTHRDVQLQLQKKLLSKDETTVKERKRKIQSGKTKNVGAKKGRASSCTDLQTTSCETSSQSESSASSNNTSPIEGSKPICDKFIQDYNHKPATLPDFNCFQKPETNNEKSGAGVVDKSSNVVVVNKGDYQNIHHRTVGLTESGTATNTTACLSSSKGMLDGSTNGGGSKNCANKYKTVQPKPLYQLCDNMYNPLMETGNRSQNSEFNSDNNKKRDVDTEFHTELPLSRERLNSISNVDKDAMDDYLGKNNSQHEEELSRYFGSEPAPENEVDDTSKISQLRQLLQENASLVRTSNPTMLLDQNVSAIVNNENNCYTILTSTNNNSVVVSGGIPGNSTRRRVSFDVMANQSSSSCFDESGSTAVAAIATNIPTVPPSPNTRRKNFSFTPISPGPNSPGGGGGRQSKCSSTSVSPFVSPRNTPIPKGRNYQNQGLTLQLLPTIRNNNNKKALLKKEQSLDLSPDVLTIENNADQSLSNLNSNNGNNLAMSAPASPLLKTPDTSTNTNIAVINGKSMLQTLLNTNGKVSYTPNYIATNAPPTNVGNVATSTNLLNTLSIVQNRSQSVPIDKNPFIFEHDIFPTLSQDDFNELDAIGDEEKIGVNNIINSLSNDEIYNNNNNENIVHNNIHCDVRSSGFRAVEVRSVPSTPLPFLRQTSTSIINPDKSSGSILSNNNNNNNNNVTSHSYPSTPLTLVPDEIFTYNIGDCLINGQRIKQDELVAPSHVQQSMSQSDSPNLFDETSSFVTFESLNEDGTVCMDVVGSSDMNFNISIN